MEIPVECSRGQTSNQANKLIETTYESMCEGIKAVKPGISWATLVMQSKNMLKETTSV